MFATPTRFLAPAALLALACAACEPDPNRQSSEDQSRLAALELPLNRVVIDSVDLTNGDKTDWKYFTINSPGLVVVTVNFDNEEAGPNATMHNAVGQVMSELVISEDSEDDDESGSDEEGSSNNTKLRQLSFQAEPANYYLQFWVDDLRSDYTVEVKYSERE